MDQRTCNIIRCCKGGCEIPIPENGPLKEYSPMHRAVAAYMSRECACPMEDYTGGLMEQILQEALFDYIDTADKPSANLRDLFHWRGIGTEPTMAQRIMTMFQLIKVSDGGTKLINGFTEKLLDQSQKDLSADGDPAWTVVDQHMVPVCKAYGDAKGDNI